MKWLAAVQIPFILLVAPAAAGMIGHWVDGRYGLSPFCAVGGLVIGMVAAVLRIRRLLEVLSQTGEESRGSGPPRES